MPLWKSISSFRLRRISSFGGGEPPRPELKLPTYEEAMEAKRKDEVASEQEENRAFSCKASQEEEEEEGQSMTQGQGQGQSQSTGQSQSQSQSQGQSQSQIQSLDQGQIPTSAAAVGEPDPPPYAAALTLVSEPSSSFIGAAVLSVSATT